VFDFTQIERDLLLGQGGAILSGLRRDAALSLGGQSQKGNPEWKAALS
jgi:hypothetical protein